MSSLLKAEAVLRRLELEIGMFPSRPAGYAHRKIVRVDYSGTPPDAVVFEVDELAQLVDKPGGRIEISSR